MDNLSKGVSTFNKKQRYNKTKTRNRGMLPRTISAKTLRAKYSDKPKEELERQLELYKEFGKRDALDLAFPETDSRLSKWEAKFFEANREKTRKFYDNEINDLEKIIGGKSELYQRQHQRLVNLSRLRAKLDKDLSTLSEDEIKSLRTVYNYAERSELSKQQGFRTYLSQLERTMDNLGYDKSERDELLNKFNVLSENEFYEMMMNENIIDAVYDLIDSPKGRGEYELMTDEERARAIVTDIQNRVDSLIAKYKVSD